MSNFDKPYRTLEEMIEILKSRNISIVPERETYSKQALSFCSYYALVNGNKRVYCDPERDDWYKTGTTVEHLYMSHYIQTSIHFLILSYIIHVENSFKTKLASIIAEEYGIEATSRFDNGPDNYLCAKKYIGNQRVNTIIGLEKKISELRQKKGKSISYHYLRNKNHLPPWILVRDLPFGFTVRWYKILKNKDKINLCRMMLSENSILTPKEYSNTCPLKDDEITHLFVKIMDLLVEARNSIAHGERLLPYRLRTKLPKSELLKVLPRNVLSPLNTIAGLGKTITWRL